MNTRPLPDNFDPSFLDNRSMGDDESQRGIGNPRINIDLGKSVNTIATCTAICGICVAVTIGTVWHAKTFEQDVLSRVAVHEENIDAKNKQREDETQARLRVVQNHADSAWANAELCIKDVDKLRVDYALQSKR